MRGTYFLKPNLRALYFEFLLEPAEQLVHIQIQMTLAKLRVGETMAVFRLEKTIKLSL